MTKTPFIFFGPTFGTFLKIPSVTGSKTKVSILELNNRFQDLEIKDTDNLGNDLGELEEIVTA